MTIIQKLRARLVICQVAHKQRITPAQCRAYMAAAIEEAWVTTDPVIKQHQIELVGDTHTPSPEELILLTVQEAHRASAPPGQPATPTRNS